MKLYETTQKYEVDKHGSTWVDINYSVILCPDCASDHVSKEKNIYGKHVDEAEYICYDCGCKFTSWKSTEKTTFCKALRTTLHIIAVLLVLASIVLFISGFVVVSNARESNSGYLEIADITKALVLSLLAPTACLVLYAIVRNIRDRL